MTSRRRLFRVILLIGVLVALLVAWGVSILQARRLSRELNLVDEAQRVKDVLSNTFETCGETPGDYQLDAKSSVWREFHIAGDFKWSVRIAVQLTDAKGQSRTFTSTVRLRRTGRIWERDMMEGDNVLDAVQSVLAEKYPEHAAEIEASKTPVIRPSGMGFSEPGAMSPGLDASTGAR